MSRIVIEDLPRLDSLTEEQLAKIFGAGRQYRRLAFQMLEDRKMSTANAASTAQVAALAKELVAVADIQTVQYIDVAAVRAAESGQRLQLSVQQVEQVVIDYVNLDLQTLLAAERGSALAAQNLNQIGLGNQSTANQLNLQNEAISLNNNMAQQIQLGQQGLQSFENFTNSQQDQMDSILSE